MDEILAAVHMGAEAERFLETEMGRYLVGCAKQEVLSANEDLLSADVEDKARMRSVQLRMAVGLKFQQWITELINRGVEAGALLQQSKQE